MKPEDALKLVDSICSQVSLVRLNGVDRGLTRAEHVQIQQAIKVLTDAIAVKKEEKPKEDKKV